MATWVRFGGSCLIISATGLAGGSATSWAAISFTCGMESAFTVLAAARMMGMCSGLQDLVATVPVAEFVIRVVQTKMMAGFMIKLIS